MARNIWNWQNEKWPHFSYGSNALSTLELQFSQNTGTVLGALKHVHTKEKNNFLVKKEIFNNKIIQWLFA